MGKKCYLQLLYSCENNKKKYEGNITTTTIKNTVIKLILSTRQLTLLKRLIVNNSMQKPSHVSKSSRRVNQGKSMKFSGA